jgi:acetyl-CoA carboxylase/biotin carboxylase 1
MEMYADEDARGGVLEPEGIVNIKYRRDKQLDTMARLDATYASLKRSLTNKDLSSEEQSDIKVKMSEREALLLPIYSQISLQFADLHDRAGRMQAKGVIRMPLRWKESRRFFYWRLRRRLNEEYLLKKMTSITTQSSMPRSSTSTSSSQSSSSSTAQTRAKYLQTLRSWSGVPSFETDDRAVALWYEENRKDVFNKTEALRQQEIANEMAALLRGPAAMSGFSGVKQALGTMPLAEREKWLKMLSGN